MVLEIQRALLSMDMSFEKILEIGASDLFIDMKVARLVV
jgi:hypothetical protein